MTILTVNIDKENDLPALIEILDRFGLSYEVNDDSALEASLQRGLDDSKRKLTRPHKQVMEEIRARFK